MNIKYVVVSSITVTACLSVDDIQNSAVEA